MPWVAVTLAVAALAAVALALALFVTLGGEETVAGPGTFDEAVVPASGSLITPDERILMQLANQGYIPNEAVDWEDLQTKALVNEGLIPAQALQPAIEPGESPYTAEERLMMDLANRGLIPDQAVDWETIELKRLINQGLIPRQAAP
jgi:hypothetical protein